MAELIKAKQGIVEHALKIIFLIFRLFRRREFPFHEIRRQALIGQNCLAKIMGGYNPGLPRLIPAYALIRMGEEPVNHRPEVMKIFLRLRFVISLKRRWSGGGRRVFRQGHKITILIF